MWRSLPLISSILLSRSLNDRPISGSFLFPSPIFFRQSVNRFARNFFQRGHPCRDFDQSATAECEHAALDGLLLQLQCRGAHQHEFLDLIVHFHDLVQAATSLVAGVVAGAASLAFLDLDGLGFLGGEAFLNQSLHRNFHGLRTLLADTPDQSLGTYEVNRGRNQKWFNTHVHQTRDRFRSAVGVQGREHKVTRQRSLDGDFSRFEISNFAHEDDVRILPQERTQGSGKVQSDLLLHLHLVDPGQLKFDRILRRHDVGVRLIQPRNRRVQRVGLAGSRRPCDQHHPVRLQNGFFELDQRFRLKAELGHVEPQVFFVQQPQHDLFAPQRRQRATAEVELLFAAANTHLQHDAAVLRQPLLADVQLGHDFKARRDGVFELHRRRHDRLEHTINSEADAEFLFVRLDMDVAGAPFHSVPKYDVHQLDHGSFVGGLFQLRQLHLLFFRLQFDVALVQFRHRLHHGFKIFFLGRSIGFVDAGLDRTLRSDHRLNVEAGHELDVVHREHIGRIDHRDGERSSYAAQGKNLITLGGFKRNQLDNRRINFKIREVDGRHAVLARKKVRDVLIREEAELHQCGAQAGVLLLLGLSRLFQLLWGNDLLFDEEVTQPLRHTSISYPRGGTMPETLAGLGAKSGLLLGEKRSPLALTQIVNATALPYQLP